MNILTRHEAGVSCGPGQLCWTPETTGSLDVMDTARDSRLCKAEEEESEDVRLKKGVSVPNVSREEEEDRLSSSSDNCKSHKKSFLRSLGLGGKAPGDAGAGRGPKVKSLRKTLSSLFKGGSEDSGESRSSFAFLRLPSRGKSTAAAAVPPCQRALPPVPARQDTHSANDEVEDEGEEESRSLELRDSPDMSGARDSGQGPQADNLMDFAASIERVKDVSLGLPFHSVQYCIYSEAGTGVPSQERPQRESSQENQTAVLLSETAVISTTSLASHSN